MKFPKLRSTFGITPYNPERDTDEKRRAIFEHYQSQMGAQPLPPETLPWNKPFPPGVEAQQAFDTMLQERVVDPLARAGYEDLGAGLAAIPSAAHEMIVPQTEFDVGMAMSGMIPKFGKIKGALRTMPERVDETGAAFKAVGKSEFTPFEKPDVAPVRMDERGRAFENIGQSDFMPYEMPQVGQFEDVQKRNYVERDLGVPVSELGILPLDAQRMQRIMDSKGKFDPLSIPARARARQMQNDMAGNKSYKQIAAESRAQTEARELQSKMYPKKQMKPELEAEGEVQKPFEKTKKAIKNEPIKFKIIKIADGKDVTDAFGIQENLAGFTQEELQNIVDRTSKKYKVVEEQYVPSGQKNTL